MMTATTQELLKQALSLPPIQRVELVERILSSFEFPARHEVDALWADEVEDRIDAFDRGALESPSADEVFASVSKP